MSLIRNIPIACVISVFTWACTVPATERNWILEHSEIIEHHEQPGKKIQTVYSTMYSGPISWNDSSMIVQQYVDSLLIDEVEYQVENGRPIVRRHQLKEYNADGTVSMEIDSIDGSLRSRRLYFYEDGKLRRLERLIVLPDYDGEMQIVGMDTTRSTLIYLYDETGKPGRVIAIEKDELASALHGTVKYDTSVTYKQFDAGSRETLSFEVTDGDTTFTRRIDYDSLGRTIAELEVSVQSGLTAMKFEYDTRGNRVSERFITDELESLTTTEYDSLNRPIKRSSFSKNKR
jgi:YD repeat-containing protein